MKFYTFLLDIFISENIYMFFNMFIKKKKKIELITYRFIIRDLQLIDKNSKNDEQIILRTKINHTIILLLYKNK
jgi:hypothetical protein